MLQLVYHEVLPGLVVSVVSYGIHQVQLLLQLAAAPGLQVAQPLQGLVVLRLKGGLLALQALQPVGQSPQTRLETVFVLLQNTILHLQLVNLNVGQLLLRAQISITLLQIRLLHQLHKFLQTQFIFT